MRRPRLVLVVLAAFALALGLRWLPLAWSPYPATLDGLGYAALARDALAAGGFPFDSMRADNAVFASFLATAGAVLGVPPLSVAQPAVGVVGAATVLVGVAVVGRFGRDLGLDPAATRLAAALVGLGLAVDGLYLRRTGVPDEEALAFLLLPLLVLALHRGLRDERAAWLGVAGVLLVAFPLAHTFSTLVAATTLLAWLVAARGQLRPPVLVAATVLVGGFWAYVATYYELTARLGMVVPYVDRVTGHPGLFLAWLVALCIGVWWFGGASPRSQRGAVAGLVVPWVAVVLVNVARPVFPGTVASPGPLALLLAVYLVPVLLAAWAAPRLGSPHEGATVLLALLAAPVALVGFALTADLTPEFFGTAMRAQTFAHLPLLALAAVGVAGGTGSAGGADAPAAGASRGAGWRRPTLAGLLLAALVVTAPVAYVDLDTLAAPSTTTPAEFRAASFAAERLPGGWTSDHVLTRIAVHYYPAEPAIAPTAAWLAGGPPPGCALLSATSWSTTGAHLFPAGPRTTSPARYDRTLAVRHHVYASGGGFDGFALTLPRASTGGC